MEKVLGASILAWLVLVVTALLIMLALKVSDPVAFLDLVIRS